MANNSDQISMPDLDPTADPINPIDSGNADSATLPLPEAQPAPKQESMVEVLNRLYGGPGPTPIPAPEPVRSSAAGAGKEAEPGFYSAIHPDGGLVAMRLLSRMQTDLAILTQDKRPATYEEVDEAYSHALRAIGLAPPVSAPVHTPAPPPVEAAASDMSVMKNDSEPLDTSDENGTGGVLGQGDDMIDESVDQSASPANGTQGQQPSAPTLDTHINQTAPSAVPAMAPASAVQPQGGSGMRPPAANSATQGPASVAPGAPKAGAAPAAVATPQPFVPQSTRRIGQDLVIAAHIGKDDIARLSGRDIVATPAMKAFAAANVAKVVVDRSGDETIWYGYLMPDGRIELRPSPGKATDHSNTGLPFGPGKVIFGMHPHPNENEHGMVDDTGQNSGYGDTRTLAKFNIPMATVINGQIGWHEMAKGQLIFTAPAAVVTNDQRSEFETNLRTSQRNFLMPRIKKTKAKAQ